MTTIRPNILPPGGQSPQSPSQDQAKLAAQRAFFDAALRQAGGPAASAPAASASPAVPAATAPPARAAVSAEAPQRILRPGSLIDIRV